MPQQPDDEGGSLLTSAIGLLLWAAFVGVAPQPFLLLVLRFASCMGNPCTYLLAKPAGRSVLHASLQHAQEIDDAHSCEYALSHACS